MRKRKIQDAFKVLGEIFSPLIPGFIIAGISAGFATLLRQFVPGLELNVPLYTIYKLLLIINHSFTPYMTAWLGYLTCKRFGGTAILGGMIGMLTGLADINDIAEILGLSSILQSGLGGVIAAFIGAMAIAKIEGFIHKRMIKSLDLVFTPLLAIFIIVVPYILIVMPFAGYLSQVLCFFIEKLSASDTIILKIISGFICAAIFLPINVSGLQYGIIALYPIQLEKFGYITLYPVFAMAGAGQVGAGLAIWLLAKRVKNDRLSQVSISSVIPGMLGIGTPLIYGVTLPIPKSFIASCLGAGVGGAFIMCSGVVATGWGPSGLLALPMMAAGNMSGLASMGLYLAGLTLSAVTGFILCLLLVRKTEVKENQKSS